MKNLVAAICCFLLSLVSAANDTKALTIVPRPASVAAGEGQFTFAPTTKIAAAETSLVPCARLLSSLIEAETGYAPEVVMGSDAAIVLTHDATLSDESYTLTVTTSDIRIASSTSAGAFYAVQTLQQLLPPPTIDPKTNTTAPQCAVPAVAIADSPRFAYRGLMLDVARFFIPKDHLLQLIDCMAMLKLNKLHMHLCDDNGWRIEIKRYPKLTEVGSRCVERQGKLFPERRNEQPGEPTVAKGFYSQADMKEIVAYAAERHIEVIPEIEMPAHSNAALAAYPSLACPVVDKHIGVLPGLGGDHADIIYCAGNDSVFTFLEGVLDEVLDIFPSHYVHLGGDEARKTYWHQCPLCQARMQQEGLADEEALQGYFMARVSRYVQQKGREVIGWDEWTNAEIPEGAVIMGWQGYGQAALKAAAQGHRYIMTPARVLYLIRYQGPQWFEPTTYYGNNTLKDIYDYEPLTPDTPAAAADLLLGVQASLWTEFCNGTDDVDYLLFPRLTALAEVGWSARDTRDWQHFLTAADAFNTILDRRGIGHATSMYNIQHTVTPNGDGSVSVALDCIRPDVEVRYTTDGGKPTSTTKLYHKPMPVAADVLIKGATFDGKEQKGATLPLPISFNKATGRTVSSDGADNIGALTNGVRGSMKYTDGEWASWHDSDEVTFTVDLGKKHQVNGVKLGTITNYGMAAHKPRCIEVWLSDDGTTYTKAAEKTFDDADIFREGTFREDITFDIDGKAKYVRIKATGAGACPDDHVRPGQAARIYFDEIIVN